MRVRIPAQDKRVYLIDEVDGHGGLLVLDQGQMEDLKRVIDAALAAKRHTTQVYIYSKDGKARHDCDGSCEESDE